MTTLFLEDTLRAKQRIGSFTLNDNIVIFVLLIAKANVNTYFEATLLTQRLNAKTPNINKNEIVLF